MNSEIAEPTSRERSNDRRSGSSLALRRSICKLTVSRSSYIKGEGTNKIPAKTALNTPITVIIIVLTTTK